MRTFLLLLLATLFLPGCGESQAPVYPVTGSVTFNGQPLTTGTVIFVPKSGGPPAQGEINSDGKFSLTTFTAGDGAVPGTHTVMVSAMKDNGPAAAHTSLIPDKFASDKSGLVGEVKEQQQNVVDLVLQGKAASTRPPAEMP